METSSRKQSFSQASSSAVPEVDALTGAWARVAGAVVPLPDLRPSSSPCIHPTAIVERGAELGPGVVVGPYAYIGPRVVIGEGTRIGLHAIIEGRATIGPRCQIHHGAAIGNIPQDLKFRSVPTYVTIGMETTVREYATIHAATEEGETTVVGDRVLLMAYTHVAHNCRIGNQVILANAVNLAGHVRVDDYAILGGLTPVHQFVSIGTHAFIGGGSRVPQDVPPYVKAAGNPLRACGLNSVGMERRGIGADVRLELKRAYRILYRSQLNVSQALDRILGELKPYPEVHELVEFVRSSERGIVR
jgi:UDP-N-acetylglucosamine acyltransferase